MPEEDINIFQVRDNTRTRNVSDIGYIPAANIPIGERKIDVTDSPLSYVPYIGNSLQGFQAMLDYYNGNYVDAAIGASLLAAPSGISRITRKTKHLWAPIIRRGLDKMLDSAEGASPKVKAFLRKYVSGVERDLSKIDIESIRKSVIDYQKRRDLERAPLISGIEEKLPDYRAAQTVSVRPATNRENFINRLKLTDSDTGYGFAGALNNGMEIAVFPGYARPDILGHEFRHSVQSGFNGLSLPVKKTTNVNGVNVPGFDFLEITRKPLDETNRALNGVREILEKRNPNSSWHQKLTELDAELERARQLYYPNTSWKELYSRGDSRLDSGLDMLRRRFNLVDNDEANYLMQTFYENGYNDGGKIYIKPSHRGRLTELKARTGKTEAELYNDGNPAHKKMVVFARNARKWHADGGLLADAPADIEYANKWDRISNARYTMANSALLRSGSSKMDADRLARFLAAQSALEAGWVDESKGNNYAGYMSNGKRMSFDSADAFWDYHLKNLDERWPAWRNAQTIDDYYNTVNSTALGLTTKEAFNEYNRKHRDAPAYIYAPDWENENYLGKLQSVYNKYISKYVKPMFDAGGFIQKHGRDKIIAAIAKMKQF